MTDYITTVFEGGEKNSHRLTVYGLTYLRELDGSNDPVKAGFSGLQLGRSPDAVHCAA